MTDDLTLLASTYLDGEATPDERARVEGDPELLAEVERLRSVRAALHDTSSFARPGDDTREAAIAAALAAWDPAAHRTAGSRVSSTVDSRRAPVLRFERRRLSTRWLSAAAAIVAIAALGVVVVQVGDGDNNDSGDESATFDVPSATQSRAEAGADVTEEFETAATADALITDDGAPADAASDEPDADLSAEAAPSAAGATEAPPEDTATASEDVTQASLETPEQLGAFAAEARSAMTDGARSPVARPCPDDTFDDIDTYVREGVLRGRQVVIGVDDQADRSVAVDPDNCEIVAEAPLP